MMQTFDTPSTTIWWRTLGVLGVLLVGTALLVGCKQPAPQAPVAEPHMQPQAPIRLPIPLDKAGYKVDTTFWFIDPDPPRAYFVGLNIPFTAGDGRRIELIDAHPVKAKVTLHRMEEGGAETKMVLKAPVKISKPGEPYKSEWIALPDDVANSRRMGSYGTDDKTKIDGATYELRLGSAGFLPKGQYRLQVELLEDNPALKDMPAYLIFDLVPISK